MTYNNEEECWGSAASHMPQQVHPTKTPSSSDSSQNDLPKSVLEYYLHIETVLTTTDFENKEHQLLLEEKFLEQVKEDGALRILYHWDGSRVLERVIAICCEDNFCYLGNLLLPHAVELACHNTASHVLETFLTRLISLVYSNESSKLLELAEKVFRKLCLNVPRLLENSHGSYTLRLALQVLVGHQVEDEKKTKKRWCIGRDNFFHVSDPKNINSCLKRILHKFTKRLMKESVAELVYTMQGAPLISVLLLLLHRTENKSFNALKEEISKLLSATEDEYRGSEKYGPLPKLALNSQGSYVLQSLLKVSTKTELEFLYEKYFNKATIPLALHPIANYIIQTLLDNCPNVTMATTMCNELFPLFEDLLAESATGVVIAVLNCCHRYAVAKEISKLLLDCFHIPEDKKVFTFRCILSLKTYEVVQEQIEYSKKPTQSGKPRRDRLEGCLTGSLLLQALFKLGEIELLEDGLCSLSEDHIVYLCDNKHTSHAMQTFFNSANIPDDVKHRFIQTAIPVIDKFVTSPTGSHVFEALFSSASNRLKKNLCQVLQLKESVIKFDKYGCHVWKNCYQKYNEQPVEKKKNKRKKLTDDRKSNKVSRRSKPELIKDKT